MWRVVLRSHQRHRMRLVLICLAISVGVAFLAGTFILTNSEHAANASTADQAYANVSVAVQGHLSSSGQQGLSQFQAVPEHLLPTVLAVPGVARAAGEVDGYAQLVAADGTLIGGATSSAQGISVGPVPSLRPFVLDLGRLPATSSQVVVDAHTFAAQGWHLGQTVRVVTAQPTARFTVVGTIRSRQSSDVLGTTLVGFTQSTAQHLLGTEGSFSLIVASAQPGVSERTLASRVAWAIGPQYYSFTGSFLRAGIAKVSSRGALKFGPVLDVVLGLALFVGALVIFNIISLLVAQRRRELALLRCLGATRTQIYRSVLAEAAVLGFVASTVGLGLGIAAAALLLRIDTGGAGAQTSAASLDISFGTVAVSLVVGTAVTMLASLLPAIAASRIPPVSALRQDAMGDALESSARWRGTGFGLASVGLALVAVGLFVDQGDQVEIWLVGAGMALGLVGLGRLSPLLVPPIIGVLGWPLQHLSGLAGHLGRQNTMRNARRTVVTATALVIGVALVSTLAIMSTSFKASSNTQLGEALTADFTVLHNGDAPFTVGPAHSLPISVSVLNRLQAEPGLVVSPFAFVTFRLNGAGNFGAAVDPSTIGRMNSFGHVQGSLAELASGGFAASVQQAAAAHLHVGERVNLAFNSQLSTGASNVMRVDAIYQYGDGALSGYIFSTATAYRIDPSLALTAVLVKAQAGVAVGQAGQQVTRAVAGFSDVSVQDPAQVQAVADQSISGQLNLISILLVLAIVVALLGIVNTLALSVVERTRELALLRAIGMTRAQMRAMVRSEAALIGMVGALLGVALGLFLGWVFQRALSSQIQELAIPWARLVAYVVAGAATGILAGTVPARRAARVNMLDAISSE